MEATWCVEGSRDRLGGEEIVRREGRPVPMGDASVQMRVMMLKTNQGDGFNVSVWGDDFKI